MEASEVVRGCYLEMRERKVNLEGRDRGTESSKTTNHADCLSSVARS